MYGFGFGINLQLLGSPFAFSNSDAEVYYNALASANGGDINAAQYSMDLDTLKGHIDTYFVSTSGIRAKIIDEYLFIGGTAATHAVCATDAVGELMYNGSPTHGAAGMSINGSTQHADMNNDPRNEVASGNLAYIAIHMHNVVGDEVAVGSRDGSNSELFVDCIGASDVRGHVGNRNANKGSAVGSTSNMLTVSRTAATDIRTYENGVQVAIDTISDPSALPTNSSSLIGAWSNNGTTPILSEGDVKYASWGDGLTPAEVLTLYNAVNTLNTALGR